jgi:hypothetical protein
MISDMGMGEGCGLSEARITYIWKMLAELRQVAAAERADMLCYLLEMAYIEAGETQKRYNVRHPMESDTSPPTCRCKRPARSSSSKTR